MPGASCRRVVVIVVVIVDVIGRLSHTRRRGHHRNGLVISKLTAAPTTLQYCDKTAPILLIEESIENRIYAGVTGSQPLGDRCGDR